jgi:hypothetical protein
MVRSQAMPMPPLETIRGWLRTRRALGLLIQLGITWLGLALAGAAERQEGERFHPVRLSMPNPVVPSAAGRGLLLRLSPGRQAFEGVTFAMDGAVELLGLDAARQGEWVPPQSEMFPLTDDGKLGTLNLLHGLIGEVRTGTPVMAVVFLYADGTTRLTRIAAGVHVRPVGQSGPLADPRSRVVWTEASAGVPGGGSAICLTRLPNPRPGEPLRGIQFVSLFSDASPLVVAVAWEADRLQSMIEKKPTSLQKRAASLPDDAWRRPLRLKVTEKSGGGPITNAEAFLSISDGEIRFLLDKVRLNALGEGTIHYPPAHTVAFDLVIRAPGKDPVIVSRSRAGEGALPETITTELSPGIQVGGTVRDAAGKPITGAFVTAYVLTSFRGRSWGRADLETVRTDSQGQWTLSSLPAEPEGVDFEITHPGFVTRRFRIDSASASTDRWSRATLVARDAVATLEPAPQLTLTVNDDGAKPLAQVLVSTLKQGRLPAVPLGRTDERGQFVVSAIDIPSESGLLLEAPGFAPHLVRTSIGDNSESVSVALTKPVLLTGVVQDQQGAPVPGMEVRLETWNETPLFPWKSVTDEQGRFAWSNAAPGMVMLRLTKTDYQQNRYSLDWNAKQELRLTAYRHYIASGTVVDAMTRKPIRDFRVLRGWSYNTGSPMQWERYNTFRGRNGAYSVRLQNYGSNARLAVMIEAPGYLPMVSQEVKGVQSITQDFELHPGRGLSGVLLDPDGKPLGNATLTLLSAQESVYLEKPGPPSRSSNYSDQTKSDSEGRFEFQPRLFASRVVAVHDSGFADISVDELKVDRQVNLQAYGRIEGTFQVGDGNWKPVMQQLRLQTFWLGTGDSGDRISATSLGFRTLPAANGRFVFDKVPPGLRQVSLEYKFTNRRNADTPYSHDTLVYVSPGETSQVVLGGAGRLVRGTVRVSGADPEMIDWTADVHRMTWLSTQEEGFPLLRLKGVTDSTVRAERIRKYEAQLSHFMSSAQGLQVQSNRHSYALVFRPNGTFEVENVMPGRYSIQISPNEHDPEGYNSRQLGFVSHEVQIPAGTGDGAPFDLAPIDLVVRGLLKAGRKLPAFQVEGLDGKPITQQIFQGKVGILYLWSARNMNDTELKMLRDLVQPAGNAPAQVELLMWNIDGDATACRKFVEARKVPGQVCALISPIEHPLIASLGIENFPSALVLDPASRVVGFNLRGNGIKSAVTRALRPAARPRTTTP